jgi:hypothetical protein
MPNHSSQIALFRKLALSLEGAVESAHVDHPDFRLNNRIFATLYGQEKGCGVLKLTPEQQQSFLAEQPQAFSPVAGGWGRNGMTYIHLDHADEAVIAGALTTAHHNLQQKQAQKRSPSKNSPVKSTPGKSKKTK